MGDSYGQVQAQGDVAWRKEQADILLEQHVRSKLWRRLWVRLGGAEPRAAGYLAVFTDLNDDSRAAPGAASAATVPGAGGLDAGARIRALEKRMARVFDLVQRATNEQLALPEQLEGRVKAVLRKEMRSLYAVLRRGGPGSAHTGSASGSVRSGGDTISLAFSDEAGDNEDDDSEELDAGEDHESADSGTESTR